MGIREEVGSDPHLNFCMEKIELTKEQIMYIAAYLDEELETQVPLPPSYLILEGAIDAFNGGAR